MEGYNYAGIHFQPEKYENYREQFKRLNKALANGFNLEAMFIEIRDYRRPYGIRPPSCRTLGELTQNEKGLVTNPSFESLIYKKMCEK